MDANFLARFRQHLHACFNPRARDGREAIQVQNMVNYAVSIHAPVMDAKFTRLTS